MAPGATRRRIEGVLPAASALSCNSIHSTVILFLRYRLTCYMLANTLIMFRTSNTVGPRQSLQVTQVKFAKLIETYGSRLAAFIAPDKMEGEPATVFYFEGLAAIKTPGFNYFSHPDTSFNDYIRRKRQKRLRGDAWRCTLFLLNVLTKHYLLYTIPS
jgi:hypothetical protein